MVLVRDFVTGPARRVVGRARDAIEVILPPIGAIALVVAVWLAFS